VDASPKGDAPGFVQIVDDKTIVIPDRPGNKLAYGHLNIIENPQVGLLMTIPGTNETLRINGKAALSREPELLESLAARGRPAVIAIKIHIEECFFHCGKASIRSKLWNSSEWPAKHKVSFGEMYAKKKNLGDDVSKKIDESIQADYRDNL
jgi:PPOX class probable FMN-dependent enzyme